MEEQQEVLYDRLGREITPGCVIIYGSLFGRSAGIRVGKVLDISYKSEIITYNNGQTSKREKIRIGVRGVDQWGSFHPTKANNIDLGRKGVLQGTEHIVVIDEAMLPEEYRALLATLEVEKPKVKVTKIDLKELHEICGTVLTD